MRRGGGYSLVEMLMVLALLSLIMASIYAVLREHRRYYATQARTSQLRDAIGVAAELLASELRKASPPGDFYSLEPDSLAVRSTVGMGIACSTSTAAGLRIRLLTGSFGDGRADSLSIYRELEPSHPDGGGVWEAVGVREVDHGAAGRCPDGRPADLTLHLENPDATATPLSVGAPVRAFRPYVYRLYARGGQWWLGQRLRGGSIQPVVGPLADPGSGGLRLQYMNADGAEVTDPGALSVVRVTLRSTAVVRLPRGRATEEPGDSISLIIYLRNS